MRCVNLEEKVTVEFYDQEHEEWGLKEATIEDVLDSVCSTQYTEIDAKPVRHGHWEFGENEYGDDGYYCSACHGHVVWKYDTESVDFIKEYNYCPFCCANMDGEEE